jgi:hypothetical protein
MAETKYFEADAKNVRVGGTLRITGRGLGVVESILTDRHEFITQSGLEVHISRLFRVCLRFDDAQEGVRMLSARDTFPFPGYGTYLPGGHGRPTVWRTLI